MNWLRTSTVYGLGLLFGTGLVVSGLARPSVIVGALDVGGAWNPAMFVTVAAALAVFVPLRILILKSPRPVLADRFPCSPPRTLDARLISGAAIFGFGLGLCGNCPGQSITAVAGSAKGVLFVAALVAGMGAFRAFDALSRRAQWASIQAGVAVKARAG